MSETRTYTINFAGVPPFQRSRVTFTKKGAMGTLRLGSNEPIDMTAIEGTNYNVYTGTFLPAAGGNQTLYLLVAQDNATMQHYLMASIPEPSAAGAGPTGVWGADTF